MHSVTIYTRVSPKLSKWLKEKNVTDDEWLTWLLRENPANLSAIADEMQEAATAGDVLMSPILEVDRLTFDSMNKVDAYAERNKLFPTSKPKYFASTALISRFISKWFEMLEKEELEEPYRL